MSVSKLKLYISYVLCMVGNLIKLYLMSGTDYFHKQNDFNLHIMYFISCGV